METFTCTVVGGIVTRWIGTAFNCTGNGNAIGLFHDSFFGIVQTCGTLTGRGTVVNDSVNPNCYTSELTIPIASDLNGLIVNCTRNEADNVIGSHTLRIAGKSAEYRCDY